jgi:hypothetical protein
MAYDERVAERVREISQLLTAGGGQNSVITGGQFSVVISNHYPGPEVFADQG